MTVSLAQRITQLSAAAALLTTLVIGIYMARPWTDTTGYTGVADYLGLIFFLAIAITPYIYLIDRARRQAPSITVFIRLAAALLICGSGIFALVDNAFVNVDAQGGLSFAVLPFYQWLIIAVFEALGRFLGRPSERAGRTK